MPSYNQINRKRDKEELDRITRCRALYCPEGQVFTRQQFVESFLIRGSEEKRSRYENRGRIAHYIPHCTSIINYIANCVGSDPLRLGRERDEETGEESYSDSTNLDPFWTQFMRDTSPLGASKRSFQSVMLEHVKNILVSGSAWIGIDTVSNVDFAPSSRLEDEQFRSPYIIQPKTDQVISWSKNEKNGDVEWLVYKTVESVPLRPDASINSQEGVTRETFYWIDAESTRKYVFTKDNNFDPNANISGEKVEHGYGRVPWIHTEAKEKWAMNLIYGLQVEMYNQENFISYAKRQTAIHTLFISCEETGNGSGAWENFRLRNAGSGREIQGTHRSEEQPQISNDPKDVVLLPINGKAEYVGPPPDTFEKIEIGILRLMNEMYRITYTLSLAANMDSAALRRSGDSKAQDKSLTTAYLDDLGATMRDEANRIKDIIDMARGSDSISDSTRDDSFIGARVFDCTDTSNYVRDSSEAFSNIPMISETATKVILADTYQSIMGNGADAKTIADMRKDVEQASWKDLQEQCAALSGSDTEQEIPRERDPSYEQRDTMRESHRR